MEKSSIGMRALVQRLTRMNSNLAEEVEIEESRANNHYSSPTGISVYGGKVWFT